MRRLPLPPLRTVLRHALAAFLGMAIIPASAGPLFQTNDVVAFVGGASVIATDQAGLLESVLTLAHPGHKLRFRALAWEGDTVFSQPRELNFPSLPQLLRNAHVSAVCVQFGALEALDRSVTTDSFREGYRRLVNDIAAVCPRVVIVVPPPFEPKAPPLPDFTAANEALAQFAQVARRLAEERRLHVIDLHREFLQPPPGAAWTHDGRDPTAFGHRQLAAAWARQLGLPAFADRTATPGFWERPEIAQLQVAVKSKNQLWFHAWRPMNWAFLAGDRTEQQASRDHRDPKIRWFPAEMEQYGPLVTEADARIESLAAQIQIAP